MPFPYYTEPTHTRGTLTNDASNGTIDTSTANSEGRLIVDMSDRISLLAPSRNPFTTLLTNIGKTPEGKGYKGSGILKKVTGNPEFKWLEDFYGGRYCRVSSAYATSGLINISVTGAGATSAYIFTPGDVILNQRTGERMIVSLIQSSTQINIAASGRSVGSTAASAGVAGDEIFIVGNANEENAAARNMNTTQISNESNYTQIFRTTFGVSDTEKNANLYGGSDMLYRRSKKGAEHELDIERALWFGEKGSDTNGTQGKPRRFTGGILEFLTSGNSYVQNQGGLLTAPDMNTFLREGFTYGDTTKFLFCGGIVLQAINEIVRGQLMTKMTDKSYGVSIKQWISAFGTVNIVQNPLFTGEFSKYAFLLDMSSFKYRYLKDRDTRLKMSIQGRDIDGQVDEFITECGLERQLAPNCALLKGVQA